MHAYNCYGISGKNQHLTRKNPATAINHFKFGVSKIIEEESWHFLSVELLFNILNVRYINNAKLLKIKRMQPLIISYNLVYHWAIRSNYVIIYYKICAPYRAVLYRHYSVHYRQIYNNELLLNCGGDAI